MSAIGRILLATIAAALLLAPVAASATAVAYDAAPPVTVERGVVQWVNSYSLTLKELDGTSLSLTLASDISVQINGQEAEIGMIRPGFVVQVSHRGKALAFLLKAWGHGPRVDWGLVQAASSSKLTIDRDNQSVVVIRVDAFTVVIYQGKYLPPSAVRPGWQVKVIHSSDPLAPALRIVLIARTLPHLG